MEHICGNCAIWIKNAGGCPFFNEKLDKETPACHKFTNKLRACAICGKSIIGLSCVANHNEEWYEICQNCDQQWGNCATCANAMNCDYETNPINLPKQVPIQTRKGSMVINAVGRNPARIQETCAKGCVCWKDNDCWCNAHGGMGCDNWKPKK